MGGFYGESSFLNAKKWILCCKLQSCFQFFFLFVAIIIICAHNDTEFQHSSLHAAVLVTTCNLWSLYGRYSIPTYWYAISEFQEFSTSMYVPYSRESTVLDTESLRSEVTYCDHLAYAASATSVPVQQA
jgi:hypothetical protein